MVENLSSASDFITSPELEAGIINGSIITFTISEENLPYYLKAASTTNYEVRVIAESGQYYITDQIKRVNPRLKTNGQNNTSTIAAIRSQDPVKKGSVGISLKKPEGVTNDTAFHITLQRIQPA